MPRRRNITNIILNTAVFIILEIAALGMTVHSGVVQNFFITKAFHGFVGYFWGAGESISGYFSLGKENKKLADQIFQMNKEIAYLNQEIIEFRTDSASIKGDYRDGRFSFVPAAIIKNSINKQHNYLIIDKGSDDGIKPQSGVITPEGVVGIVDAISRHYSYVISFLNSEISISGRIGHEGAAGPVVWDGKRRNGAIMKEIPLQYKFNEDDTVYTSGFSSIFPPDIPIGTTGKSRIVNGATYEINVKLFQDFSALRYVTVVSNKDLQEIENLVKVTSTKTD